MKKTAAIITLMSVICFSSGAGTKTGEDRIGLTLIPPGTITDKVDLDIRAGIVNDGDGEGTYEVSLYLVEESSNSFLTSSVISLGPGETEMIRYVLKSENLPGGGNSILLRVVTRDDGSVRELSRKFEVIKSSVRSTGLIDGAWAGIYHWSEDEGRHWNADIRELDDSQWRELVRSMHKIGMDIIVIQEVFRNNDYVGKHSLTAESYQGRAFYPSELYPGRMPIKSADPLEAILAQADECGMSVLMGVGMFAWFDFTEESLEWHKNVAKELWERYGHHDSFYGFYVSEECAGNLYNSETTDEMKLRRKKEISDFFREFKRFTSGFAPEKPVMLATNSMGVMDGADGYPALVDHLDSLCAFGFARIPEGDLTGKEAADLLQSLCDQAGAHLWFDLEAFLFNPDMSLYPRPADEIIRDLNLFDNFEKVLCYQYPGVFSDPEASVRVGEERTVELFKAYKAYREKVIQNRNNQ